MKQIEYAQKKRECWKEFCKSDTLYDVEPVFNFTFDRAYALGKAYCAEAEAKEETLSVRRKRVQEIYSYNEEILSHDPAHSGAILLKKKLTDLFGSKCLPNETRDKREKRQIKRELNEDNFAKSDASSTGGNEVDFTSKAQPGTNCNGYDDRRLHIAAQILAALYANELYARHRYMEQLVETALKATDLLIAESEKGGKDGE